MRQVESVSAAAAGTRKSKARPSHVVQDIVGDARKTVTTGTGAVILPRASSASFFELWHRMLVSNHDVLK
jgi:hypothetical protein